MNTERTLAASGALVLHACLLAGAWTITGPSLVHTPPRPIEVSLIRPPEAPPVVRPPEPLPVNRARPEARKPPPPAAPPAPAPAPAVAARPTDEARPASITAEPAPPAAPVAPRVTEGVPAARREPAPPAQVPAVRVGPRADASWSGNLPPAYPAMARRLGEEGEVQLDIHVAQDGAVDEVRLKKSSGSGLLDRTAIDTVKKWRFKPATVDGKPVDEWYFNWKWVFKLEG